MPDLRYTLYRRRHVGSMDQGAHIPALPVEGGGDGRVVEWPAGIRELWVCRDPSRSPGVGVGRSKKDARAALRRVLALEDNPRPLSRRATRRVRRVLQEPPQIIDGTTKGVVIRDATGQ